MYLVLGLGISGKAVIEHLLEKGEKVAAFDDRAEVCAECEVAIQNSLEGVSELIISPGVRLSHPLVQEAIRCKVPVTGEVEFGLRQMSQVCIGVTGTNGKTTVTEMIAHGLRELNRPVYLLGNGGVPLISHVGKMEKDAVVVLELSSFQLETMKTKALDAAIILNITDDHIDWHGSFENYAKAKWRIKELLKPGGKLLVNDLVHSSHPIVFKAGSQCAIEGYVFPELFFEGVRGHHLENLLAVLWALKQLQVPYEAGKKALKSYKVQEHRIEFVRKIADVPYYNDSKGTNTDATLRAVQSFDQPIWLIAGGVDKGLDFSLWREPFLGKVKGLFLIGQAAETIEKQLQGFFTRRCVSLEEAVAQAASVASQGELVLLSPGCSSFDQFRSYADRGNRFKEAVMKL